MSHTYEFEGATAGDLARVLATAPLVGDAAIFGRRTVRSSTTDPGVRRAEGFEPLPIPLLRFDFSLTPVHAGDDVRVIIAFSQPHRKRPYLEGEFVWFLEDGALREEINTASALNVVDRPLHGRGISLRRFLFFSGGHRRLMEDVTANLRSLLG